MNNFHFIAVIIGFCLSFIDVAFAQTNVNLEQVNHKGKTVATPKFIEDIEINPVAGKTVFFTNSEEISIATSATLITANSDIASVFIEKCNLLQFKYALLTDRAVETMTNTHLLNFIDEWWGTPYKYGGIDKAGIDCSAFTGKLLATIYNVTTARTAAEQYQQCEKIAPEDLMEGDLVFFKTSGSISHVGMYLGNQYFVHSSVQSGVTISSMADGYYSKKFVGFGRMAKL
jgi:lipoprotein Spr